MNKPLPNHGQFFFTMGIVLVQFIFATFSVCSYAAKLTSNDFAFKNRPDIVVQVTGIVKDENGDPLPGVNVLVKGTTIGTNTDAGGKFSLEVADENSVLVFSFIGYNQQEVAVGNQTQLDITLTPDILTLGEIVVVGYGTQEKINVTGALSTMDADELQSRPITQASQALQGKMAGVTITQNFGIPGNDAGTIRIRGVGTISPQQAASSNSLLPSENTSKVEPLVLIDGVQGSLNEINPRDIENITVLKDAASSSIYGSRAANGVILVTTKRGTKKEGMTVTYSGLFGTQLPTNLPEVVDGATHMMLKNENERNNSRPELFTSSYIQNYQDSVGIEPYFNTDWYKAAMKNQAMQHQHTLTVRGGTDKISALVSVSSLTQEALIKNTEYDRKTLRFNTDFNATNKLSFALDGSLYIHEQSFPSRGEEGIFEMMAEIPQIYPATWSDGRLGEGWNGDNPLGYINEGGGAKRTNSRIILNMKANYQFTDWLSAEVRYSPKYLSTYRKAMVKKYTFRRTDGSQDTRPTGNNSLENAHNRTLENFYQGLLRFKKNFQKHSIAALAGIEALDNRFDNFSASRQNFLLDDYEVLSGGDANLKDNAGGATEFALLSYLGRINYSYNNKYLLEANLRYDGSSRFSPENRWSAFPSFSAGWRIVEEDFMKSISLITDLKIRASWGRLGNQNIGNYPYQGLISVNQPLKTVPYYLGKTAVPGAVQTVLPNENVKWETTEDINVGIDFGLFNNRLTGSLDLYKRNTHDILYIRDIPAVIGLQPSEQNIAEVENKGWDLQVSWNDRIGGLTYGVDFVLSDVHNKVLDLNGKPVYGRNAIFEGQEYQAYYGYENLGIYRSQNDLDTYPALNTTVKVGDLIFKDQNEDGVIDATNDKKVIGSSIPRYNYGVTLFLGYRNFDLTVFMQGVGKKDLYYNIYGARFGGTYYAYQLGRLVPDDPTTWETADRPRLTDGTSGSANNQDNSFHLYNAAYLRCKHVALGYNFPEPLVKKISLTGLRLYVTGQNLFTISDLKINTIDPEAPDTNEYGASYYPNVKTFAVGVDVRF